MMTAKVIQHKKNIQLFHNASELQSTINIESIFA